MGWVRGIREVRHVVVALGGVEDGHRSGPHSEERRVIIDLPPEAWQRVVRGGMTYLPAHTGAGPCGTVGRGPSGRGWVWWWSIRHLINPLRAYYAAYAPPMRFGAKPGPRGRRAA